MLEYAHYEPGRLRLKISELRHRRRAAEAASYLSALPMVTDAAANSITGSLTINFDERQVSLRELWEKLQTRGYVFCRCPDPTAIGPLSAYYSGAYSNGGTLVAALFEAIAQHSAQALVRALL